jgi:hypothetical protein
MSDHPALPALYDHMIECGIVDLDPWAVLRGDVQSRRAQHIEKVLPGWGIIPYARRTDNDDVACWTGSKEPFLHGGVLACHMAFWRAILVRPNIPVVDHYNLAAGPDFIEFDWS